MNKKVIRQKREAGSFTQVPLSILRNKKISAGALRALLFILSEADSYKLYKVDLAKKLEVSEKQVQKYFQELEELGYMRRTPMPRGNYYTISEYGNLAVKEVTSTIKENDKQIELTIIDAEENIKQVQAVINENAESFNDPFVSGYFEEILSTSTFKKNGQEYVDIPTFKELLEKVIEVRMTAKKETYKEIMAYAEFKFDVKKYHKKLLTEFKKKIQSQIFDKHTIDFDYKKTWLLLANDNRKKVIDWETEMSERLSGED